MELETITRLDGFIEEIRTRLGTGNVEVVTFRTLDKVRVVVARGKDEPLLYSVHAIPHASNETVTRIHEDAVREWREN